VPLPSISAMKLVSELEAFCYYSFMDDMKVKEMKDKSLKAYTDFKEKHWNAGPTILQFVISAHLYVENSMDNALLRVLPHDNAVIKLSFWNKVTIMSGGGLDQEILELLTDLNKLRNKFAHNLDYVLKWSDIQRMAQLAGHTKAEWESDKGGMLRNVLSYVMGRTEGALYRYSHK
jgi:hypothetical protein